MKLQMLLRMLRRRVLHRRCGASSCLRRARVLSTRHLRPRRVRLRADAQSLSGPVRVVQGRWVLRAHVRQWVRVRVDLRVLARAAPCIPRAHFPADRVVPVDRRVRASLRVHVLDFRHGPAWVRVRVGLRDQLPEQPVRPQPGCARHVPANVVEASVTRR